MKEISHADFPLTFHWKAAAASNPGKKGWSVSFAPVPCPAGEYVGEEGKCIPMYCEIKTASEWTSLGLQVGNVSEEKNHNNANGVATSYATVSFVDASATTACGAALSITCLENYGDFIVVGQCATCGEITNGGAAFSSCTGSRVYDSTKAATTSPNDANCCKDPTTTKLSSSPSPSSSSNATNATALAEQEKKDAAAAAEAEWQLILTIIIIAAVVLVLFCCFLIFFCCKKKKESKVVPGGGKNVEMKGANP